MALREIVPPGADYKPKEQIKIKPKPLSVSVNPETKSCLLDLAFSYGLKRTPTLVRMIDELSSDPELRIKFSVYIKLAKKETLKKRSGSRTFSPSLFVIPAKSFESLNRLRIEMKYIDISPFLRLIIQFFHYQMNVTQENTEKMEIFRKAIEVIFEIDYMGMFEGKLVVSGDLK